MTAARARYALGISTAFTAVLLGGCNLTTVGETARTLQPVGCLAATVHEANLAPDAPYRTRLAATTARAAACTPPT